MLPLVSTHVVALVFDFRRRRRRLHLDVDEHLTVQWVPYSLSVISLAQQPSAIPA